MFTKAPKLAKAATLAKAPRLTKAARRSKTPKRRAGTPAPTVITEEDDEVPLGEAPLKPEMKGYSLDPFAELTCPKGHTVFRGHFAQAKYQDHSFIGGVNKPCT